jgi:hypothetical protein
LATYKITKKKKKKPHNFFKKLPITSMTVGVEGYKERKYMSLEGVPNGTQTPVVVTVDPKNLPTPELLAKEFVKATVDNLGTDEDRVYVICKLVHDLGMEESFNSALRDELIDTDNTGVVSSAIEFSPPRTPIDYASAILIGNDDYSSEMSGAQLKRALDYLKHGEDLKRATKAERFIEGLATIGLFDLSEQDARLVAALCIVGGVLIFGGIGFVVAATYASTAAGSAAAAGAAATLGTNVASATFGIAGVGYFTKSIGEFTSYAYDLSEAITYDEETEALHGMGQSAGHALLAAPLVPKGARTITDFMRARGLLPKKAPFKIEKHGYVKDPKAQDTAREMAQRELGEQLPPDVTIYHIGFLKYLPRAKALAREIPAPREVQNRWLFEFFFRRSGYVVPQGHGGGFYSEMSLLRTIAQIYKDIKIDGLTKVLEGFLTTRRARGALRKSYREFASKHLYDTLKAMEGAKGTVEEMIAMLNIARRTAVKGGDHPLIGSIAEMTQAGVPLSKQIEILSQAL